MKSAIILFLAAVVTVFAAPFSIKVTKVDGNAQIKGEESRQWKTLKTETELYDNDVIQTSFKSNCEINIAGDNILFMGANSRLLVNFVEKAGGKYEVSITLFAGSVYSNIAGSITYVIYSTTATGRAEKASFNTSVDEISGITGFHIFKGDATVSNLSVQGDQPLKAGETSTIAIGAQPTAPKRISSKQMSVLTRFYGSEFINKEIERTGLEMEKSPVAESIAPVETIEEKKPVKAVTRVETAPKAIKLFNPEALLKKIEEDEELHQRMYKKLLPYDPLEEFHYRITAQFAMSQYNGASYNDYILRPGFYTRQSSVVLNLPVVADSLGAASLNISGVRAALDKIYSADLRYKRHFLHLGDIHDLTVGRGLVMRDYTNRVFSDNVRNLGLYAHYQGYFAGLDFFTPSIADFHLIGLRWYSIDSADGYSIAFLRESGEALNLNNSDFGFRSGGHSLPGSLPADSFAASPPLAFGQFDFNFNLLNRRPVKAQFYGALGVFFMKDDFTNLKGYSLSLPGIEVTRGRIKGRVEAFINHNTFPRGLFGPLYEDNMFLLKRDVSGGITGGQTLASILAREKTSVGISAGLHGTPLRGLTLGADFETCVRHFGADTSKSVVSSWKQRPKVEGTDNGFLDIRLNVGKGLTHHIPWVDAHYRIGNGGYYDGKTFSPFTPNPFTTYGVTLQGFVVGRLTASFGWEGYYYDRNGDNRATVGEKVTTITAGLGAGF